MPRVHEGRATALALARSGVPDNEIVRIVGASRESVRRWTTKAGLNAWKVTQHD